MPVLINILRKLFFAGQPHKNFLKKPPNAHGVNTLLTFWGDHMG
jgi:hypothetical protein